MTNASCMTMRLVGMALLALATGAVPAAAQTPEELARGEELFGQICTLCHTIDPPALKAPPIRHVARHLREAFATDDEAVEHIVSFVRNPHIDRSVMPPMAIQRFGLMPAQGVPEEMVRRIARWILSLEAPAAAAHATVAPTTRFNGSVPGSVLHDSSGGKIHP